MHDLHEADTEVLATVLAKDYVLDGSVGDCAIGFICDQFTYLA
jgi:hypothetical protein